MRKAGICSTAAVLAFVASLPSLAGEVAAQYDCTARLDPERVVKALIARGLLESSVYAENDSISYFKALPGSTAFGLPLVAVAAFKEESSFFRRAPGTSPGNRFAFVVQAQENRVLNAVHAKGLSIAGVRDLRYPALKVETFTGEPLPKGTGAAMPHTQVLCLPKV